MVLKLIVIGVHLFIHAPEDITRCFTAAQPVVDFSSTFRPSVGRSPRGGVEH
ncbi:hypothetical protein KCP77_20650 [Salmonella enterica subsp. enterica]|nr:hypothetical protein KCP77_20650 [Salmonella enterica subsp. enterica]